MDGESVFVIPAPPKSWFYLIKKIIYKFHPLTEAGVVSQRFRFIENYCKIDIFKVTVGGGVGAG